MPQIGDRMHALVEYPAEVHSVSVTVIELGAGGYGRVESDSKHEMSKDCPCGPIVNWHSSAAPRPLYEHREPPEGVIH